MLGIQEQETSATNSASYFYMASNYATSYNLMISLEFYQSLTIEWE